MSDQKVIQFKPDLDRDSAQFGTAYYSVAYKPISGCTNLDTYGCICVKCNKCKRFK